DSISSMCKKLPVRIALLTGALKGKEREYLYEQVSEGTIDILIGTHAVIQETVKFKSLGIGIVDEQHRFGVEQRALLQRKGRYPHVLIMSATPIPRTMTLSIYGDLDVSIIKEMPPGRKPVLTYKVNSSYKKRLLAFFRKEMSLGLQIYIVFPLVEESEKLDLQAAENLYLELIEYFGDSIAVGLVHGRMPASEKETIMSQFKSGAIQLLVSTTVIEVGVNVPNATVICIEGAERFGLAQLHQLRGRVGRGITQSYCILVSDSTSEAAQERLQLMTHIQDGFELAEQDLLLRGSGQLFGLAQSGLPDLRIAHIIKDIDILIEARHDVDDYIKSVGIESLRTYVDDELKERFGSKFLRILYS
ncbi:ATP-dependent DNA helicase RecG, partial [Veillonella montpellierensis]|uniref:ATP-dependent DNA helicase RecG n=1 Tax=Veillonella montpellierensis TaxID=187328 RepID=UPI0023F8214D